MPFDEKISKKRLKRRQDMIDRKLIDEYGYILYELPKTIWEDGRKDNGGLLIDWFVTDRYVRSDTKIF